jgi:hypothetical protein
MSQLVVDSMPFQLCEEFNKLNLRIVANTEAVEMEVVLVYFRDSERSNRR